jgi:hypothetical protein
MKPAVFAMIVPMMVGDTIRRKNFSAVTRKQTGSVGTFITLGDYIRAPY